MNAERCSPPQHIDLHGYQAGHKGLLAQGREQVTGNGYLHCLCTALRRHPRTGGNSMACKRAWVLALLVSAWVACAAAATQGSVLDASGQGQQQQGARRPWAAPMQWLASVTSSFDVVAPSVFLSSNDQPQGGAKRSGDVEASGSQEGQTTAGEQEAIGGWQVRQYCCY